MQSHVKQFFNKSSHASPPKHLGDFGWLDVLGQLSDLFGKVLGALWEAGDGSREVGRIVLASLDRFPDVPARLLGTLYMFGLNPKIVFAIFAILRRQHACFTGPRRAGNCGGIGSRRQ